ncbi:hypothetical protein D3C80_1792680 [compost metagenome]
MFVSKREITCALKIPPSIPIRSQGKRALEIRNTLELDSTFSEIPEANWKSLSASSLITSTTSSIVMRPTSFPCKSTTGTETKSYFSITLATFSEESLVVTKIRFLPSYKSRIGVLGLAKSSLFNERTPTNLFRSSMTYIV